MTANAGPSKRDRAGFTRSLWRAGASTRLTGWLLLALAFLSGVYALYLRFSGGAAYDALVSPWPWMLFALLTFNALLALGDLLPRIAAVGRSGAASALSYAGILLLVGGLMVAAREGRAREIVVDGEGVGVEEGAPLRVRLLEARPLFGAAGESVAGYTSMAVERGGAEEEMLFALHRPRLVDGWTITPLDFLPVAEIHVTDGEGRPVMLQRFLRGYRPQEAAALPLYSHSEDNILGIPAANVTLRCEYVPAPYDAVPSLKLDFFDGVSINPSGSALVESGGETQYRDLHVRATTGYNVLARFQRPYGWVMAALGLVLLGIGAVVTAWLRHASGRAGEETGGLEEASHAD